MSILTGNNGVVKIDNASGTPTAIAGVRNFSVDIKADTIETSSMGTDARTYVKGMSSFSGSADVYFDAANYTGGASVVAALNPTVGAVGDSPLSVELYLNGTADKFSGEIIVTGYSVKSSFDGLVEASISFQGSGAMTFTV
jgi:predicted secreted protein